MAAVKSIGEEVMWPFTKKPLRLDATSLPSGEFHQYRKTALSKARILTDNDFEQHGGIIHAEEGPMSFKVGDYINMGVSGEMWPITAAKMLATKRPVTEPDAFGWRNWENINTVRAAKIEQAFEVKRNNGDVLSGKAGDYLVDGGTSCWIVDAEIFKKSHVAV